MQRAFKFILTASLGSVLLASMPAPGAAQQSTANKRAALVAQLAALTNGSDPQLVALEQQLGTAQAQVAATRRKLDWLNGRLVDLAQKIADNQHTLATGKLTLGQLLHSSYEISGGDNFESYVFSATDFSQVVDRLNGAQHMTDQLHNTLQQLADAQKALGDEQQQMAQAKADAQKSEDALNAQTNWLLALIANRDAQLANSSGQVRALIAQIDGIDQGTAASGTPRAPVSTSGPCGNHFAFGQCTWYVATRRCIPWFGNAYQWWSAARQYGYSEGSMPAVGAVVVWYPGGGGASWAGHVGYVEQVGPAPGVPAGWFRLSEMNFAGWDTVDYRTLPDNSAGIAGFIY